jgi:hypothetical protein
MVFQVLVSILVLLALALIVWTLAEAWRAMKIILDATFATSEESTAPREAGA